MRDLILRIVAAAGGLDHKKEHNKTEIKTEIIFFGLRRAQILLCFLVLVSTFKFNDNSDYNKFRNAACQIMIPKSQYKLLL